MAFIVLTRLNLYWQHIVVIFHHKVQLTLLLTIEIIERVLLPLCKTMCVKFLCHKILENRAKVEGSPGTELLIISSGGPGTS